MIFTRAGRFASIGMLTISLVMACSDESDTRHIFEVAFVGDVHFHDVFAEFHDGAFAGLPVRVGEEERYAVVRTMEAQLMSTRLFNENYFVFLATLDDIVARGIRFVVLPGDFSDDGQPIHLRGLRKILERYERDHGLRFFLAPGNHDPVRPYSLEAGKWDFLGEGGMAQPIFSSGHVACIQGNEIPVGYYEVHPTICSDELIALGYEAILTEMGDFGLVPGEADVYFETPFSEYHHHEYDYSRGLKWARYDKRQYEVCHQGSGGKFRRDGYSGCLSIADMSYLVEPVEGLWLLSIDANVYVPIAEADTTNRTDPSNFEGPGNAGFNSVMSHKRHLLDWIDSVHSRADSLGKTVFAFSHYPAVDFYRGARPVIEELWGRDRFQLARVPEGDTSRELVRHGLRIHVGTHMHMNNTGLYRDPESGGTLFNIQSPSLAGYMPAYKILSSAGAREYVDVETVVIDDVPGFDSLFPLYEMEWRRLYQEGQTPVWDRAVLESRSYREYIDWHLRELTRLRFMPQEWPEDLILILSQLDGFGLKVLLMSEAPITPEDATARLRVASSDGLAGDTLLAWLLQVDSEELMQRSQSASERFEAHGFTRKDLEEWSGEDVIVDLYRLRNAGSLAARDIPRERLEQYRLIAAGVQDPSARSRNEQEVQHRLRLVFETITRFAAGMPDADFRINVHSGTVERR